MKKELSCIMLVDDDEYHNFYHEREIQKTNLKTIVITKTSGLDALEYLKSNKNKPDLIFLDINMPTMDGWEFLLEYSRLDKEIQSEIMIMMLTTSKNPDDKLRAQAWAFVAGFLNKPLTKEILEDIIKKYFQ